MTQLSHCMHHYWRTILNFFFFSGSAKFSKTKHTFCILSCLYMCWLTQFVFFQSLCLIILRSINCGPIIPFLVGDCCLPFRISTKTTTWKCPGDTTLLQAYIVLKTEIHNKNWKGFSSFFTKLDMITLDERISYLYEVIT